MNKDNYYRVGKITRTHGLKGEVQVLLDVDNAEDYARLDSVLLEIGTVLVPYQIKKIDITGEGRAIIQFENIASLTAAQALVKLNLYLPLSFLSNSDEDNSIYLHQVLNYKVIDQRQGTLGYITAFYEGAQQDILEMSYQNKLILIPWVEPIVAKVDHTNQTIFVDLPDGLLDIYLNDHHHPNDEYE